MVIGVQSVMGQGCCWAIDSMSNCGMVIGVQSVMGQGCCWAIDSMSNCEQQIAAPVSHDFR